MFVTARHGTTLAVLARSRPRYSQSLVDNSQRITGECTKKPGLYIVLFDTSVIDVAPHLLPAPNVLDPIRIVSGGGGFTGQVQDRNTICSLSHDCRRLITHDPYESTALAFWDLTRGNQTCRLTLHRRQPCCVAWSPSDQFFATIDTSGYIIMWCAVSCEPIFRHQLGNPNSRPARPEINKVCFSPDSQLLAVADGTPTLTYFRVHDNFAARVLHVPQLPRIVDVAFSANSRQLFVVSHEGISHTFDVNTLQLLGDGREMGTLGTDLTQSGCAGASFDRPRSKMRISDDGKHLCVPLAATPSVGHRQRPWVASVRDTVFGLQHNAVPVATAMVGQVQFDPQDSRLLISECNATLRVHDFSTTSEESDRKSRDSSLVVASISVMELDHNTGVMMSSAIDVGTTSTSPPLTMVATKGVSRTALPGLTCIVPFAEIGRIDCSETALHDHFVGGMEFNGKRIHVLARGGRTVLGVFDVPSGC